MIKPTKQIAFSYRASTGFRVPSFQELFGYRIPGTEQGKSDWAHDVTDVEPEKTFNQEVGISFKGDFGTLEMSYFLNQYKGLIALASIKGKNFTDGYHNAQDVKLAGVNLQGKIDWNGVWDKIPEGFYSTLAYNKVKPKRIEVRPELTDVETYLLDAVQPSRYIVGLGYLEPEEKWGINATFTYSKPKDPNELIGKATRGFKTYNISSTNAWKIVDVVGHYNVKDYLTLRAGVYNLFNYRYLTWESIRQSGRNAIYQQENVGNYARYAAPGRNFTLSLEMKF